MSLKKLGRYDLLRILGKGAMGIVYEGRDPNLDRRVAIKTVKVENLSEEAALEYEARFRTEARSAARLQHPNIVSVYDSDRDGDIAFLVMEYIQGDDLKHHLDQGVRYSLEQSLKMIRDLLSALDYAHKQGIVHRDVKPANLLIEPGGRVKLTDFGVARMQDSNEATRTQGGMVGTLKYMSPEQVQGQKIDSRADLFSVAVVLYQLLTDKRPFDGENDFSIIHQIIGHTPAPPSSFNARLPSAIDAVVARGLAKDREQRFATARDFAAALQSAIRRAEDATVVPPAGPRKPDDAPGAGGSAEVSAATAGVGTSGSGGSIATVTQELELVYWKDIKDSTDSDELDGFLARFPEGIYGDLARRRLRRLAAGASPDPTVVDGVVAQANAVQDPDTTLPRSDPLASTSASASATGLASGLPSPAPTASSVTAGMPAAGFADLPISMSEENASAVPAEPTDADDFPETLPQLRSRGQSVAGPVIIPQAVVAIPSAPKKALGSKEISAPLVRRKPAVAVIAGLAVATVAALAGWLLFATGEDQKAPMVAAPATLPATPIASVDAERLSSLPAVPAPTASEAMPASLLSAVSSPVEPSPAVAAAVPAAVSAKSTARLAATAASSPRKPASAASRPDKAAPMTSASDAPVPAEMQTSSQRPAPREESRPIAAVVTAPRLPRPLSPTETCKDRNFLTRPFCLHNECEKPGSQNFQICVQLNDEARLREDSKVRN